MRAQEGARLRGRRGIPGPGQGRGSCGRPRGVGNHADLGLHDRWSLLRVARGPILLRGLGLHAAITRAFEAGVGRGPGEGGSGPGGAGCVSAKELRCREDREQRKERQKAGTRAKAGQGESPMLGSNWRGMRSVCGAVGDSGRWGTRDCEPTRRNVPDEAGLYPTTAVGSTAA